MTGLRPLALGEIVDRSATFWRAHWRPLFQVLLGFQLVQYAMAKGLDVLLQRTLREALHGAAFDPMSWLKNPPELEPGELGALAAAAFGFLFGSVLVSQVTGVAATAYIYPRLTGQGPAPTVGHAVRAAARRLFTTVGAVLLSFGLAAGVAAVFFTPAVLLVGLGVWRAKPALVVVAVPVLLVAMVALTLWFVLRFILTAQVTAAEPLSAFKVVRRTGALSSGRVGPGFTGWVKGRLTILVTVVFGILFLVSTLTGLPAVMVHVMYGSALDPTSDSVPVALLVPAELLQVAASALIDPIYIVFQVIFYVDMRVRREGLDLELALRPAEPTT